MNNPQLPSARRTAQQKFNTARSNLLLMIALTTFNLVILAFGSDTMMLFSATIPYFTVLFGIILQMKSLLIGGIFVAVVTLLLYLLCWIFSKKHYGWMIAALVMFILDSAFMIGIYIMAQDFSGILDIAIHAVVLYYLIIGVKNGRLLKTLPEEIVEDKAETQSPQYNFSAPLRRADEDQKYRVLLESEAIGHRISYRRVKRVNQLVIDGYVYDEVEMLAETAHELTAKIDGHTITVGFDGAAHSYLTVDGNQIAKKLRLF